MDEIIWSIGLVLAAALALAVLVTGALLRIGKATAKPMPGSIWQQTCNKRKLKVWVAAVDGVELSVKMHSRVVKGARVLHPSVWWVVKVDDQVVKAGVSTFEGSEVAPAAAVEVAKVAAERAARTAWLRRVAEVSP